MDELQVMMTVFAVCCVILMGIFGFFLSKVVAGMKKLANAKEVTVRATVLAKLPSEHDIKRRMAMEHGLDCNCGHDHDNCDCSHDAREELPIDNETRIAAFRLETITKDVIELNVAPGLFVTFDENEKGLLTYRGSTLVKWEGKHE